MEAAVVFLVLLAALMHATWNALLKASGDRALMLAFVVASGLVYLPLLPFVPPPAPAAWPFLAGSALVHLAYFACLLGGYRHGDLGQVYPVARGSGPLFVAALAAIFAGEALGPRGAAGIALVSAGILWLAALGARGSRANPRALAFALATGAIIAAYTTIDGLGVRASGAALSYVVWGSALTSIAFPSYVLLRRRGAVRPFLRAHGLRALTGGLVATLAYSIAVWAMSLTRLAYVASLRETSVIFAAILGARFLGEPFGARRTAAAGLVAGGIVLLAAGSG